MANNLSLAVVPWLCKNIKMRGNYFAPLTGMNIYIALGRNHVKQTQKKLEEWKLSEAQKEEWELSKTFSFNSVNYR